MGIFYPNFLMLLPPLRLSTCFAPPLEAALPSVGRRWVSSHWCIFAPCGPFVVVLPVMQLCPLWAVDGNCPPREAALPPWSVWWVVLPVRQPSPLWAACLSHIFIGHGIRQPQYHHTCQPLGTYINYEGGVIHNHLLSPEIIVCMPQTQ